MTLNDAQTRFLSELQTMLPLYKGNSDPRLKTPATNLEWNVKKLSGQGGEQIDGPTFAQRTQADLELVAAALPAGAAGQGFATHGAAQVADIFGAPSAPAAATAAPASAPAPAPATSDAPAPATTAPAPAASAPAAATDVKALLSKKADSAGEKLAWQTSVVDLLKLLGKDSSQSARHRYAVALGFPEDQIADMPSSEFNTWLHGQLLSLMAHNGGNLPASIA